MNREEIDYWLKIFHENNHAFMSSDGEIIAFYKVFEQIKQLQQEKQELKKQLVYLRSGEYLNQLKFERNMLEDIVQNMEVSKEDKEFIDMTHRNTELLEENNQLKAELELHKGTLKREHEAIHKANDLEDRIEKAIEHCEIYNIYVPMYDNQFTRTSKIIEILKGVK